MRIFHGQVLGQRDDPILLYCQRTWLHDSLFNYPEGMSKCRFNTVSGVSHKYAKLPLNIKYALFSLEDITNPSLSKSIVKIRMTITQVMH